MLVYSPFLIAGFVGMVVASRRRAGFLESRLVLLGAIVIATILLYARFTTWHGGLNQFGYRYLLDAVPFLIVLTVYALDRLPRLRLYFMALGALSVLTMIFGSEPNRFSWDFTYLATRLVDTSIGQAWTVAVNYPVGNLVRAVGVAAVAYLFFVASRFLSPAGVDA